MGATPAISSFDAIYRVKMRFHSKQTNTSLSASYSQQRCQTHKKVEEKWNFCLILFFKFSDQFFVKRMVAENRNQTEQQAVLPLLVIVPTLVTKVTEYCARVF